MDLRAVDWGVGLAGFAARGGRWRREGRNGRCRRVLDDGGADRAGCFSILHDPGEGIERGVTYHDCGLAGDAKENWEV